MASRDSCASQESSRSTADNEGDNVGGQGDLSATNHSVDEASEDGRVAIVGAADAAASPGIAASDLGAVLNAFQSSSAKQLELMQNNMERLLVDSDNRNKELCMQLASTLSPGRNVDQGLDNPGERALSESDQGRPLSKQGASASGSQGWYHDLVHQNRWVKASQIGLRLFSLAQYIPRAIFGTTACLLCIAKLIEARYALARILGGEGTGPVHFTWNS